MRVTRTYPVLMNTSTIGSNCLCCGQVSQLTLTVRLDSDPWSLSYRHRGGVVRDIGFANGSRESSSSLTGNSCMHSVTRGSVSLTILAVLVLVRRDA